jgi:hypothetical protein
MTYRKNENQTGKFRQFSVSWSSEGMPQAFFLAFYEAGLATPLCHLPRPQKSNRVYISLPTEV